MSKKEYTDRFEIYPTDDSPRGLEELKFILEAMFAKFNACKNEEELRRALIEDLARPEEEWDRETKAVIEDAKRRFQGKKDC